MKKETIIQFVGFVTSVDGDTFAPEWERFAKKFMNKKTETLLQQKTGSMKSRFRYISQHEWDTPDLRFTFMNEKKSEHFPEMSVQVVQAGGYIPLQFSKIRPGEHNLNKIVAFISHDEYDIDFYKELALYKHLNIYQAFYESCLYGYVMEFFCTAKETDELLSVLKQRNGVDANMYAECLVPHL